MSATWHNWYDDGIQEFGYSNPSPQKAQQFAQTSVNWRRVEQRWNNNAVCPPVGMRADQASHEWRERLVSTYGVMPFVFEDQLEPRT